MRPVVGVGGRAAVAEDDQLAAAPQPLVDGERRIADRAPLCFARHLCSRSAASSSTFIRIDAATCRRQRRPRLLLRPEERVEEAGLPDVVAQLAVLEEDVNRLPERVVQDLDQLLMDERIELAAGTA